MKTLSFVLVLSVITLTESLSQNVTCTELLQFVTQNGHLKGEVSSMQLVNSSWLRSVKAYEYDNTIFVVATIKSNQYDLYGKKYIFCGIPSRNWEYFSNFMYDSNPSYGEKFRKYIFDYQCDCS